VEKSVD